MNTVANLEPTGTLSFHQALDMAEVLARTALDPALHARVNDAAALVKAGAVLQLDDGHTWLVASASTPGKEYRVNGGCSCDDAHYRAQKRCKHALAVYLSRKTLELMHAPGAHAEAAPPSPPVETEAVLTPTMSVSPAVHSALPEAPAPGRAGMRLEAQVVIDGRQVKVAVWGPDDADVQDRLAAVLAQYPVPAPASPPAPTQGQGEGYCAIHATAMHLNHGKDGRTWYSHRLAEGGFCKGRKGGARG